MARTTYVKAAQQRYRTVPVLDEDGNQKYTAVMAKDGTPKTTKSGRAIQRRVTVEDKTQPLPNYHCTKCGTEIKVGDSYKWVQLRIGTSKQRKNFCSSCSIRSSDTTTSGNLQTFYAAMEAGEDALGSSEALTLTDMAEALRTAAEGVREASEAYGESADNMEDGFGHETESSAAVREKAELLEQFADELESKADDIESMEDPEDVSADDVMVDEPDMPSSEDFEGDDGEVDEEALSDAMADYEQAMSAYESALEEAIEEEKERRRQEAHDAAESILCENPL
jgi:hypothetical protein